MTSLRTMEGLNLNHIQQQWGEVLAYQIKADALQFVNTGQMVLLSQHLILTNAGRLFGDGIAAELFRD